MALKRILQCFLLTFCLLCIDNTSAQDISLYSQFNGRYDFIFVGNTLNPQENSFMIVPQVLTSSAAQLPLSSGDSIFKAYLYWAGCGAGDFTVSLNEATIAAERTFYYERYRNGNLNQYFSAFADVTTLVQSTGAGLYTLSDLDISDVLAYYHNQGGRTNFAGWSLLLIIENDDLPLNQINIYDGLQAVPDEINIQLDNLNVVDKIGAKLGFIAWEGDSNNAENERLKINGSALSNALNPPDNAFNGTNTFTNSYELYNMDLDVYDIQDFITIATDTINISLTSDQDLVLINALVSKLNNQLPDATITIDSVVTSCGSRQIMATYTVYNSNSTDFLPSNVPIRIFANDIFVAATTTTQPLQIGEQITNEIMLTIPDSVPLQFELKFIVDQNASGNGIIVELDETNNISTQNVEIPPLPEFNDLATVFSCNLSFGSGIFDFSDYSETVKTDPQHSIAFFNSLNDAENNINPIYNTANFSTTFSPTTIYVRITDAFGCFSITTFNLETRNCPPTIYNYISANDDGANDTFFIKGLRDIFLDFKLEIYNRWGQLLWKGDQNTPDWNGRTTVKTVSGEIVPDGTYFYILYLNDVDYPAPLSGYLYFKR